jgi:hypothetical protein
MRHFKLIWASFLATSMCATVLAQTSKASSQEETKEKFQWLVLEETNGVWNNSEMSLSQLAQSLKNEGYFLKVESGVMYAMPSQNFQEVKRAAQLIQSLEPFKARAQDELSEELTVLAHQLFDEYQIRDTRFDSASLALSVRVLIDSNGQRISLDPVLPNQTKQEFVAFFSQESPGVDGQSDINDRAKQILNQLGFTPSASPPPAASRNVEQQRSQKPEKREILFFHEHRRLTTLEQTQVAARYFQLLAEKIIEERERWQTEVSQLVAPYLHSRKDWQGWQGNQWQGRFRDLPPDIQAKLRAQLKELSALSPDGVVTIQIDPVIGFSRKEEAGTYSQWFSLSYGDN